MSVRTLNLVTLSIGELHQCLYFWAAVSILCFWGTSGQLGGYSQSCAGGMVLPNGSRVGQQSQMTEPGFQQAKRPLSKPVVSFL